MFNYCFELKHSELNTLNKCARGTHQWLFFFLTFDDFQMANVGFSENVFQNTYINTLYSFLKLIMELSYNTQVCSCFVRTLRREQII